MYLHKLAGHALLEGSGQRPCAMVRVGVAAGGVLVTLGGPCRHRSSAWFVLGC